MAWVYHRIEPPAHACTCKPKRRQLTLKSASRTRHLAPQCDRAITFTSSTVRDCRGPNDAIIAAYAIIIWQHQWRLQTASVYLLRIDAVANSYRLCPRPKSHHQQHQSCGHLQIPFELSNCLVGTLSTWAGDKIFAATVPALAILIRLDGDIHVQLSKYNHFAHVKSLSVRVQRSNAAGSTVRFAPHRDKTLGRCSPTFFSLTVRIK